MSNHHQRTADRLGVSYEEAKRLNFATLFGGRGKIVDDEGYTCYHIRTQEEQYHSGFLFNHRAWWVGFHWSSINRRLCVNFVPCLTFWVTLPGGKVPERSNL